MKIFQVLAGVPLWAKLVFGGLLVYLLISAILTISRRGKRGEVLFRLGFSDAGQNVFEGTSYGEATLLDTTGIKYRHPVLRSAKGMTKVGETVIFDYQYEPFRHDIDGESVGPYRQTLVAFRVRPELPNFAMRHKDLFDKIAISNRQLIDIEGYPQFSQHYALYGLTDAEIHAKPTGHGGLPNILPNDGSAADDVANDAAIRALFTPVVLDAIEADQDKRLRVEKRGDWLLVYRYKKVSAYPSEYAGLLDSATRLATAFNIHG